MPKSIQVKSSYQQTEHLMNDFKSSVFQKGASCLSYLCRGGSPGWVGLVPRLLFIWFQGMERWSCLSSDYLMLSFGASPPHFLWLLPILVIKLQSFPQIDGKRASFQWRTGTPSFTYVPLTPLKKKNPNHYLYQLTIGFFYKNQQPALLITFSLLSYPTPLSLSTLSFLLLWRRNKLRS